MQNVDGRRRKGRRRRRQLLDATMRVIERHGLAAVSQRAVAREAGVPASAVTYYFPTADDLLVTALTAVNDDYLRRLAEVGEGGDDRAILARLAQLIAESTGAGRARVAAEYELFLLAAQRTDLQAELARWTAALDALVSRVVADPLDRAGVVAAVDGLFLRCLCSTDPPDADEVLDILDRLVRRG